MEPIKTELPGKRVILLNGTCADRKKAGKAIAIEAPDGLIEAARRNPDAVAFGYLRGKWVAAA